MLVHGDASAPDLHFRYDMPIFRSCLHWIVRLDHRRLPKENSAQHERSMRRTVPGFAEGAVTPMRKPPPELPGAALKKATNAPRRRNRLL